MDHVFKRVLSFAMALFMVLSFMPHFGVSAHAEETEQETVTEAAEDTATEAAQAELETVAETETEVSEETEAEASEETEAEAEAETEAPVEITEETEAEAEEATEAAEETEAVTEDEFVAEEVTETEAAADNFPEDEFDVEEGIILEEVKFVTTTDLSTLNVNGLSAAVTTAATANGGANWTSAGAKGIKASLVGAYSTRKFLAWTYHTYAASTTALTFTNNLASEAVFQFDYSTTLTNGTITIGTTSLSGSGTYETTVPAGGTLVLTLSVTKREQTSNSPNDASIEITNLSLFVDSQTQVIFEPAAEGGSYTVGGETIAASTTKSYSASDKVTLAATPAANYSFAGWYSLEMGYLSADLNWTTNFAEAQTVTAIFIPTADGIFGVGNARFDDLTAASTCAARSSTKIVVLLKNATITGNHTVVLGSTLLIPYNDANSCPTTDPVSTSIGNANEVGNTASGIAKRVHPTVYRTLTLAGGASITVEGAVSVAAEHVGTQAGSVNIYGGAVKDKYGCIQLNSNSNITVAGGGVLYAWGYILGQGTVTANNGATIYEKMQITDYRGGSNTFQIAGDGKGIFPFNQYYIQNIEATTILNHGSQVKAHAALLISGNEPYATTVDFIGGQNSMFLIEEGATVTKRYDGATDRLIIESNGNVSLKSMSLIINNVPMLGSLNINSKDYELPINGNITFNIQSGLATVTQDILLQPGAQVNLGKDAMLMLGDPNTGTPYSVYAMDSENWGQYVFMNKTHEPVGFAPSRTSNVRKTAALTDAVININGTLANMGNIYTTAAGASIISSQGTGLIFMMADAPAATTVGQYTGDKTASNVSVIPAKLKNGNTSVPFTATEGSVMMDIFVYDTFRDMWMKPTADLELTYNANGATGTMEPQVVTLEGLQGMMESHIFSVANNYFEKENAEFLGWALSADGEVVAQPGDQVVIGENTTLYAKWKSTLASYTITFLNEDGSTFKTVTVLEGTTPDPEGIPTKAGDMQYTSYTFAGWDSNNDGKADNVTAATGNQTYKAVFTGTGLKTYNVVFYNEDGSAVLYTHENVAYGTSPSYEAATPTKAADAAKHYSFAGWSATKGGAAADVTAVNGTNLSYYAVFTGTAHTGGAAVTENEKAATCGADGSYDTVVYCSVCGEELSRVPTVVPATGNHNYVTETEKVDATCTEDGYVIKACACGATEKTTLTAPGHKDGEAVTENEKAATCGADGSYDTVVYCSVCGEELSRVPTVVPATGNHNYVTETEKVDATCTEDGYVIKTCACGATEKTTLTASGHKEAEAVTENEKAATCGADGSYDTVVYCSVCGEELSRVPTVVPATGNHNYVTETEKVDATCTEDGYVIKACACGATEKTTLTASGHKDGEAVTENEKAATCGADGSYDTVVYCSVCGEELSRVPTVVPATGNHNYATETEKVDATCTEDGYVIKTCACGATEKTTLTASGHKDGEAVTENEKAATCGADGSYDTVVYCSVCGEELSRVPTVVPATGNHNYATETEKVDATCTEDGYVIKTCACGATEKTTLTAPGHKDGEAVTENEKAATCGADGSYDTVVYCSVCGEELSRVPTVVPATGNHNYVTETEKVDATCTEDGYVIKACACGATEKTTLTASGHDEPEFTNDGDTHSAVYPCCGETFVTGEGHTYSADEHKCVCGDVETFTVYWFFNGKMTKEIYEYGATVNGFIPERDYVNTETHRGWFDFSFWIDSENNQKLELPFTMPARNMEINAQLVYNGWFKTPNGQFNYYAHNEEPVKGWFCVNDKNELVTDGSGNWYYGGDDFKLATGATYVPYPTELGYGPDQDAIDSMDKYPYDDVTESWFIFDENGVFQSDYTGLYELNGETVYAVNGELPWLVGLVEVEGEYYYFGAPRTMIKGQNLYLYRTNDIVFDNGAAAVQSGMYTFTEDGKLRKAEGITNVNGTLYYYENYQIMAGKGLIKVDGNYYYVRSNGTLVVGTEYWVANVNEHTNIPTGTYTFDENGVMQISHLAKNGIYQENGQWYYYVEGMKSYAGMISYTGNWIYEDGTVETDTSWIYIRSNGQLATGRYWITATNGYMDAGYYNFDEMGKLIGQKNGVIDVDGTLYYYKDDVVQYNAGLINLDGNYYYVRSNGVVVAGQGYWITNVGTTGIPAGYYEFDANGVMQLEEVKNGVVEENGVLYYYENGSKVYAGLIEYNGGLIYVRSNGQLAIGKYWVTKTNGLRDAAEYTFGADGMMINN